jgi:hypothetical protein
MSKCLVRTCRCLILINCITFLLFEKPAFSGSNGVVLAGTENANNNSVQTPTTIPPNSSYNYNQQITGYGISGGCGTQLGITTNYGNQNTTNGIPGYTLGANIIFNSQECTDPKKQTELQTKQIQSQRDTTCITERTKFATTVFTANPKITPEELNKMLDVVCK